MPDLETWKTWEGRVVDGKFPLRKWIGGSDRSAVFQTERGGVPAAIKLIAAGDDAQSELARVRAAAQLAYPGLLPVLESGIDPKQDAILYVVMELADDDLSRILPDRPLSASEVGEMMSSLLDLLSFLHEKGFAHGHLKPSNVLAVGERLKLSSDRITPFASTANRVRRDAFDAPEISSENLSPASDVWSLGTTLVVALTQNPPLDESSQRDPVIPKTVPEPFRGIARECLHLDPKRRCSLADIRARLETSSRSVPATPELPQPKPPSPRRLSWRILIPVAVLLIGIVCIRLFRGESKPPSNLQVNVQPTSEPSVAPVRQPAAQTPASSKGAVVHKVLPDIPPQARHTISGTVRIAVRVEVDASGAVTNATLADAGPSQYFATRVLKAAQQWEFAAPRVNGQPVASKWLLHFRLKRNSTQADEQRLNR